jgi:outer membrane protein assembly factor BamB
MRARAGIVVVSLVCLSPLGGSARAASCAPADHAGGDWPSYGHDLANTRSQPLEDVITPGRVPFLSAAWTFNSAIGGDPTDVFTATPIVYGGCVYVGGTASIYALNADTGELVWRTPLAGGAALGTTLAAADGRVFVHGGAVGAPSVSAFDASSGAALWTTVVSTKPNSAFLASASPVPFDGMVFSGTVEGLEFTDEARSTTNGSFSLLDASTGTVIKKTHVIPEADYEQGYTGANIWATAVIDRAAGLAYVGTAAPYNAEKQHPRTDAILKIDVDPSRETFGEIVDFYRGVPDYYFHFQESLPCTRLVSGSNTSEGLTGTCAVQDLDFGASPNLFTDAQGRTIVGEVQKAGIYHAVDTSTMDAVWTSFVAAPHGLGTLSSTAYDGHAIYGAASYHQSQIYALDPDTGDYTWLTVAPDTVRASPTTVANGVVYQVGTDGLLLAHDAAKGVLLLARPVAADAGPSFAGLGTGVAVARNTVYVNGGGAVVAYRVDPAGPDVGPLIDMLPTPPTIEHQEQPPL